MCCPTMCIDQIIVTVKATIINSVVPISNTIVVSFSLLCFELLVQRTIRRDVTYQTGSDLGTRFPASSLRTIPDSSDILPGDKFGNRARNSLDDIGPLYRQRRVKYSTACAIFEPPYLRCLFVVLILVSSHCVTDDTP